MFCKGSAEKTDQRVFITFVFLIGVHMIPTNDIRIVSLECPYDNWDNAQLTELFNKMVALKLNGYRKEYPYGVLPVDTSDFLSTHYLICNAKGETLTPLMGFKTVSLTRCHLHNVAFPLVSILKTSGATKHEELVTKQLEWCQRGGGDASYAGSWTIDPETRKNRPLVALLRELTITMLVEHYRQHPAARKYICGSVRFKTDKFLQSLGYSPLEREGEPLSTFEQASLMGDTALALHCSSYTDAANETAYKYRDQWNSRLALGRELRTAEMPIAA
jgi:hypothetical protein